MRATSSFVAPGVGPGTRWRLNAGDRTHVRRYVQGHGLAPVLSLLTSVLIGALVLAVAVPASADDKDQRAAALKLLQEGVQLMDEGQCDDAIARFKESMEIVPSPVTQINIGTCHEQMGRIASAWAAYREAENMAREAGRKKYMRKAERSARALEDRLPRLVISAPALDQTPDMLITRNLNEIAHDKLGAALYVDPGTQDITASADGYLTYAVTVEAVEGEQLDVEVPALQPRPEDEGESSDGDADQEADGDDEDAKGDEASASTGRVHGGSAGPPARLFRWISIATIGVGIAAGAAGLGLGLSARSVRNSAFDDVLCIPDVFSCDPDGWARLQRADARTQWSNIALGAGLIAVGAGAILYWTAPRQDRSETTALRPMAGPERVGLVVSGSF